METKIAKVIKINMRYTESDAPVCSNCKHFKVEGSPDDRYKGVTHYCILNPAIRLTIKPIARCKFFNQRDNS